MHSALVLALLVLPRIVEGQVVGLPVAPRAPLHGWSLSAGVGFPGDVPGGGTVATVSAGTSLGWLTIEALGAAGWPTGDEWLGAGALLSGELVADERSPFRLRVFGGGGVRWIDEDGVDQQGLVGALFGFNVLTPLVLVQPWVAPRVAYVDAYQGGTYGGTHPAFAAGMDVALPGGPGLRLSYDRIFADFPDATTFAIGLYYSFRPGF